MPMKLAGRSLASASPVIGRVDVFEPNIARFGIVRAGALRDFRLHGTILEHRFDQEIDALQVREIRRSV